MPTPILSYQPRPHEPPPAPEYDYHFQNELARRLRRRFLWYTGLTVTISLAFLLPGMIRGGTASLPAPDAQAGTPPTVARVINYATSSTSLLMYASAFVYVYLARRLRRDTLLRLALWLYVLASIPGMLGMRLIFQITFPSDMADRIVDQEIQRRASSTAPSDAMQAFASGFRSGLRGANPDAATQPNSTQPAPLTPAQRQRAVSVVGTMTQPGFVFALTVPFVMLFHHTFACLFIPWTLRQSLAPAGLLLLLLSIILIADLAAGGLPWWMVLGVIPLTALTFVPGSAWCWWRFAKIKREIRLHYESDRYRSLQADMASARRILESALPQPRYAGPLRLAYRYEPMRQIGGDLLFVHPSSDARSSETSRLCAVLLDVTGHGIAAALSVNRLVGELERLFAESPRAGPSDVLCSLNRYVYFTMSGHDTYVTAIALCADAGAGTIAYASAGHPTAFLRRASGEIVPLDSTTMLLGVADAAGFTADPVTLPFFPGDAVVAYTDGANEAMNDETGEMLGMAGVQRLLREVADRTDPTDWPERLMQRVVAHRNAPPADDTMIVVVHRTRE